MTFQTVNFADLCVTLADNIMTVVWASAQQADEGFSAEAEAFSIDSDVKHDLENPRWRPKPEMLISHLV